MQWTKSSKKMRQTLVSLQRYWLYSTQAQHNDEVIPVGRSLRPNMTRNDNAYPIHRSKMHMREARNKRCVVRDARDVLMALPTGCVHVYIHAANVEKDEKDQLNAVVI